jgi:lysophospholipase L1-like esterase
MPEMFQDTFNMNCYITPITGDNSGYWEVGIGIDGQISISVGEDAVGKFINVNSIDAGVVSIVKRIDASSLRIGINKPLSIDLYKIPDTIIGWTATITDIAGQTITFNKPSELVAFKTLHGQLVLYTNTGTAQYKNLSFGYNVDVNDVKVVVMGHSMVAGATMVDTPTARFASRIRTAIGEKNVAILGQGGIGVSNLLRNYMTSLYALRSARYVVLFIGANDPDTQIILSQMQILNDGIKAMGMTPIWLTPSPTRDGTIDPRPYQKQYMMAHFNYVDVTEAFLDDNGNVDTNMFFDEVHPSAVGHERIYNLIRAKFECIFDL